MGWIEASISARLAPRGERWRQPLLQLEVRTQEADPVELLSALQATLDNLSEHGWSPRDAHRLRLHLEHLPESSATSPRLESLLLAEVFGASPSSSKEQDLDAVLELLHKGISLESPLIVMEVADASVLEDYARDHGLTIRVLRAVDLEIEPTD